MRWDGKEWQGGDLRSRIAARCREKFPAARDNDEAIGMACDHSSFFCGLFKLLDCEIRLAVQPFVRWEMGDFREFLRALPAMCAFIASGRKPKVSFTSIPRLPQPPPPPPTHVHVPITYFDAHRPLRVLSRSPG